MEMTLLQWGTATAGLGPWLAELGGVLLHSTWKIALIGAAYWLIERASLPARVQHDLGLLALLIAVAWPAAGLLQPTDASGPAFAADPAVMATTGDVLPSSKASGSAESAANPLTWLRSDSARSGLGLFWLLGAAWMVARLFVGWAELRRVRRATETTRAASRAVALVRDRVLRSATGFGIDSGLLKRLTIRVPATAERLGVCTFGFLRPVLVIPMSTFSGLSPQHLEAVLLHELAHLRRRDGLWSAFQSVLDCLLFFHPVARWLSSRVRQQREVACDDLVLSRGIEPVDYAEALVALAGDPRLGTARQSPSALGGNLKRRIRRILRPQATVQGPSWLIALGLALFALPLMASLLLARPGSVAIEEDDPTPPHLLLRGEAVVLRPEVQQAFDVDRQDQDQPSLLVLDAKDEGRFRRFIEHTLSAPTLQLLVGSPGSIRTGIQDPEHLHSFRGPDGRVTNGLMEVVLNPHVITADATILDVSMALLPNEEIAQPGDVPLRLQVSDVVLSRSLRLVLLEGGHQGDGGALHGLLLELVSTSEEPPKFERPITFAVEEADYDEVLNTILRYVELERDDTAVDPDRFDAPITLHAQLIPAGEMLEIVLRMNCLRAEIDDVTVRIHEIPSCEPSRSVQRAGKR